MGLSHLAAASLTAMWDRLARCVDAAAGLPVTVFGHSGSRGRRAVSPVVAVVLTVAIVVVIGASVGAVGFGLADDLSEPAPSVAESNGELRTQEGYDGGIVRITHVAGDSVQVSNIEIAVTVDGTEETRRARIQNLPATAVNFGFEGFENANLEKGDESFISKGTYSSTWDIGALHEMNSNTLSAGSSFEFRINGATGIELSSGDRVTVRIIHTPSDAIIIRQDLMAD